VSTLRPRRLALALALVLSAGALAFQARAARAQETRVQGVEAVGFTVSDMDRSVEFFSRVLDFEKTSDVEVAGEAYEHLQGVFGLRMRVVRMKLGEEQIELTEYLAPRGRSIPEDARSNDHAFQHVAIVVSDMQAAYRHLRENRVRHASNGPQRLPDWNEKAGGIEAFYFKDPDGHPLEVLAFPRDKGAAKWHRAADKPFLGIDHTAIVVGDTSASLRFYRDRLGLSVAGSSENYGTEQEHLNNVFGARVRITALRAAAGPGIELLEYLAPRDGRPYPPDLKANDIAHWQTTLDTQGAEPAWRRLLDGGVLLVSPGSVDLPDGSLGFSKGAMVRDPDGHAVRIVQR
jgi:catechol 2,3-dioxygenase-like lactoylglutathione lyase family enzyme